MSINLYHFRTSKMNSSSHKQSSASSLGRASSPSLPLLHSRRRLRETTPPSSTVRCPTESYTATPVTLLRADCSNSTSRDAFSPSTRRRTTCQMPHLGYHLLHLRHELRSHRLPPLVTSTLRIPGSLWLVNSRILWTTILAIMFRGSNMLPNTTAVNPGHLHGEVEQE